MPSPIDAAVADLSPSDLLCALSHALDLTEGQPVGHCVRLGQSDVVQFDALATAGQHTGGIGGRAAMPQ